MQTVRICTPRFLWQVIDQIDDWYPHRLHRSPGPKTWELEEDGSCIQELCEMEINQFGGGVFSSRSISQTEKGLDSRGPGPACCNAPTEGSISVTFSVALPDLT